MIVLPEEILTVSGVHEEIYLFYYNFFFIFIKISLLTLWIPCYNLKHCKYVKSILKRAASCILFFQWRNTMMRLCSANDVFARRTCFSYSHHRDFNISYKISIHTHNEIQFNEHDQMILKIEFHTLDFLQFQCLISTALIDRFFFILFQNISFSWWTQMFESHIQCLYLMPLNIDNKNECVTNNTDWSEENIWCVIQCHNS